MARSVLAAWSSGHRCSIIPLKNYQHRVETIYPREIFPERNNNELPVNVIIKAETRVYVGYISSTVESIRE